MPVHILPIPFPSLIFTRLFTQYFTASRTGKNEHNPYRGKNSVKQNVFLKLVHPLFNQYGCGSHFNNEQVLSGLLIPRVDTGMN